MGVELNGKRLEILKDTIPKISRVAFLVNPDNLNWNIYPQALDSIAKHLGVQFTAWMPEAQAILTRHFRQ